MKKETVSLAILLLMLGSAAYAEDQASDVDTTAIAPEEIQESEALRALEILAKANIIVLDKNSNTIKVREDIVARLKAEGKLTKVHSEASVFCM